MPDRPLSPSAYLHTIDLCLLRYNRERSELEILLHQRDSEPFAGHWPCRASWSTAMSRTAA